MRGLGVRCLIHQPRYSMLDRWVERDGLLDALEEEGVGCIVFSPLAQGVLTDKYLDGIPEDSRAQRGSRGGSMGREGVTDDKIAIVRRLQPIAKRLGLPIAHLALKWVLRDGRVTSAVVGARTVAQIDDSIDAIDGPALAPSDLEEIEKALNAIKAGAGRRRPTSLTCRSATGGGCGGRSASATRPKRRSPDRTRVGCRRR